MNRKVFFLAVNTGLNTHGLPDARCRQFYAERSKHGLHSAIVGNVVTPNGVGTNDVCSVISSDGAWTRLANSISEEGALPGIQLSSTWRGYGGIQRFVPTSPDEQALIYKKIGASISEKNATLAFDSLNRATELALKAGFRHIQVHAAHGYLFNLLIDSRLTRHSDLARKKLTQWAQALNVERIESSIRFSMWSGHTLFDENRNDDVIDNIATIPVDYIDASAGFYNINKRLIYPSSPHQLRERTSRTLTIASRHPSVNIILSGLSSEAWNPDLPRNIHIGICRDLIANPNFLAERRNGCDLRMKCHYFSRGTSHLHCGKWRVSQDVE